MCDTMAIVKGECVLFAKNSDRDANEAQLLEWHPRREHPRGATVRCTHIAIPQAPETFAVLLSRPFWMWGAEIGTNEFGVTIGNEAVFTKQPYAKTGLLGMDLIRLALERADTAGTAVDTITSLLNEFGQGGGAGYENRNFTYHNSFIVADPEQAFVLETAGRKWAVEEIRGARSISNGLTIEAFAEEHSDTIKTHFSGCRLRRARTQSQLDGNASVSGLMRILQDHGEGNDGPVYRFTNGGLHAPCVHGGGLLAASQTTASWVAELTPRGCRHWVTATSAPCMSLFKPVDAGTPLDAGTPIDIADKSLWWKHERLHREVLKNPHVYRTMFEPERAGIQARWLEHPPSSQDAFEEHDQALDRWLASIYSRAFPDTRPRFVRTYWNKRNSRAGLVLGRQECGASG